MSNSDNVFGDYEKFIKKIGENLARVRLARGMTQRELATTIGKNQHIVSKVEKYPARNTTFRCIYEVCRGLPVSMGDIVLQAEKELELYELARSPSGVSKRMKVLTEQLNSLPEEEQVWVADMIEGLLKRVRIPENFKRNRDSHHLVQ